MLALWFIHAWLALAAAPIAAAAIAVHLLNRARAKPLRWAAMQFLQAAVTQSRRRLQLERWLLIALRTATLALLALLVARPISRGSGSAARTDVGTSLLVILDNGLAMQAPSAQPAQSLLADAVTSVLPLLHDWQGPIAVLPALGEHQTQWFDRVELAESALGKVPSTAGRADWDKVFTLAKETLGQSLLPSQRRTVLIVTSLTQGNWQRPDLLRQSLSQLKESAGRLLVLDMQPASRNNLAVTDLVVESAFTGRDLPVRAVAGIANHSAAAAQNLKLTWSVDGREVRQDDLPAIPAGSRRSVSADLPALTSGDHNVSVRLVSDSGASPAVVAQQSELRSQGSGFRVQGSGPSTEDSSSRTQSSVLSPQSWPSNVLPADDQRWASVPVPQRRRIVLVEPDLAAAPANRPSLFVAAVLSSAAQQSAVPLLVDAVAPSGLAAALIEPADVVLLCDVAGLTAADWQLLERHLDRGRGLITWLGPRSAGQGSGFRVQGPASGTQEPGLRVQGSGFRVQDPAPSTQDSSAVAVASPLATRPSSVPSLGSAVTQHSALSTQYSSFAVTQHSALRTQDSSFAVTQNSALRTQDSVLPALPMGLQTAPPRADWSVRLATPVRSAFLDLADGTSATTDPLGSVQSLLRVEPAAGARVLAQTATGLPVALLRQVGQGCSILVTTSPDLSWADMAGRPTFPAFVLGLLREAAATPPDGTQVACGQPIRLVMPAGDSAARGHWIKPDGSLAPAAISLEDGAVLAVLPVAAMPGAYQLETDGRSRTAFANADASAGDLRAMDDASRRELASAGATFLGKKDLVSALAVVAADEWTHPLLYIVLLLGLLEIVLTAVFTRARMM